MNTRRCPAKSWRKGRWQPGARREGQDDLLSVLQISQTFHNGELAPERLDQRFFQALGLGGGGNGVDYVVDLAVHELG